MDTQFITPLSTMTSMFAVDSTTNALTTSLSSGLSTFQSIFSEAIDSVKETEDYLAQQQYLLATGQIDDPHTVPIASSQAQLAVEMLVQLRNNAVEAYNELIKTSL
jgi:flagellar hook-basal body complex protein FliE